MLNRISNIGRKFCSLRGIVAIIFVVLAVDAWMSHHILIAILMSIFAYWSLQNVLGKNFLHLFHVRIRKKDKCTNNEWDRDLDI